MERHVVTLRLDPELLAGARRAAAIRGCSLNEFMVQAVARAVASADPEAAAARRRDLRARIAEAAGGPLPPAAELMRALREGSGRLGDEPTRVPRQ